MPISFLVSRIRLGSFFEKLIIFACIFSSFIAADSVFAQIALKGEAVTIDEADQILRSRVRSESAPLESRVQSSARAQAESITTTVASGASSLNGCPGGANQPTEIQVLARSLKCDLDLIFEYVHNNIEYEPLFGSNKGALGTLLDQRGNDIDQAQLFVSLLTAAGINQSNISYIYGYITITGSTANLSCNWLAPAAGWLGVKDDFWAIANVLENGGIPLNNGIYNSTTGATICLEVAHVWVQVNIGGTNYVFDPSFKQHLVSTGLSNLGNALGYNQSQFLSDAGGTIDSVSISNINRAKVRANLTAYANNLINYIKGNSPTSTLNDIIGGKTIIPLTGSPIRQTSLPYQTTTQPSGFPQNWGTTVPTAYRTCLALSMPGISSPQPCSSATSQTIVLYTDQVYGQRITVFSTPDPSVSGNYIPTLLVNGAVPTMGTNTGPSTAFGGAWSIYASITHPYALSNLNPESQNLSVTAGGSYLIGNGVGRVGRGMVAKHQQLLAQALAAPGASAASESVLGESLAVIGYHWLAENAAQQLIGDAIGQVTTQYHHGVGIVAQTAIEHEGDTQGPYVDLPMNVLSVGQQTCWPATTCPFANPQWVSAFYTDSGTASSLESAVLQQTQAPTPNMVAASTVALVDQNAGTGAKTFFADGTTAAGQSNYINMIRPQLQQSGISYSPADLAAIDIAITGANPPPVSPSPTSSQVVAPVNGNGSIGLWHGAGFTIITQIKDPTTGLITSVAIGQKISGGLSGGFSGTDVPTSDQTSNTNETITITPAAPDVPTINNSAPAPNNQTVNEPIDSVTGAEIYTHTDLVVGNGQFPYALPFGRTYTSANYMDDLSLGLGWEHSYSLSAQTGSDPYEGMGASSPISAAAAIAAIYVSQDLLKTSAQSAQTLTLAWMVNHWLTDQITNNSVIINRPGTVEEFIALPRADGASSIGFNAPLGSAVVLTGNGATSGIPSSFTYVAKDATALSFAPVVSGESTMPITAWKTPNGVAVNFGYDSSGNLTTVSNNLGRQLSFTYTGSHIASVSDGIRSVNYTYAGNNLSSYADPQGYSTNYAYDTSGTYDTAGHLTQIFYPATPTVPFISNFYDALGRVGQQNNASGAASLFYFAGSRTEIADPVGNRHVTYQTPRGKITKDAYVLSSSVGDVFNDSPQSNGLLNVSSMQYDGLDRLVLATYPEGGQTSYVYSPDLKNNLISVTQTAKTGSSLSPLVTSYTYDGLYNKVTSITDPKGLVSQFSYDTFTGSLLRVVSDAGDSTHFNATSIFTYNPVGQVLTSRDALGVLSQYSYDSFGSLVSLTKDCCGQGHANQTTSYIYDLTGNVLSVTDPNGNLTLNSYDLNRRLVATTIPSTSSATGPLVTAYVYDFNGQLVQTQKSVNGGTLAQALVSYTLTGKVNSATDANGNVTIYAYDGADRLGSVTDAAGRVTTYAYDAMNRRISVSNPAIQTAPLLQNTFTPDGIVASLTTARSNTVFSTTIYTPDGFDRPGTTAYADASTEVLGYDANNNVTSRKTRKGDTITFAYDTLNRLSTKTAPSEPIVTYSYDILGHVIGVSDNSASITAPSTSGTLATSTFGYDTQNKLISTSFSPVQAQAPPSASSSATFGFTYDRTNRRIGQTATDNSFWSYPTAASSTSYTANNLDQYSAIASVTPTYDGNGNLTSDGSFTYGYDAESRLISASGTGLTASYAYDAQGRRKSKTVNGTTTLYIQDPQGRALVDYAGSGGSVQNWYAFGSGPNDALNQVSVSGSTRATYVPDVQGSIIASLDAASGSITKAGYRTYGESTSTAGTFRYTGARIDAETNGLYDLRARVYSPVLGRFLQTDPAGVGGGVNLYAYVSNDPLNQPDPFGLCSIVGCALNAVTGAISSLLNTQITSIPTTPDPEGALGLNSIAAANPGAAAAGAVGGLAVGLGAAALLAGGEAAVVAGSSVASEEEIATTTVGRWMSQSEFDIMSKTGRVVEGAGGRTYVTNPANPQAYTSAAPGSVYAEFNVPTNVLRPAGNPAWSQIPGPNITTRMFGPAPTELAPATCIICVIGGK